MCWTSTERDQTLYSTILHSEILTIFLRTLYTILTKFFVVLSREDTRQMDLDRCG